MIDKKTGTLYDLNADALVRINFLENGDHISLIVTGKIAARLPTQVFLLPSATDDCPRPRPFLIVLSSKIDWDMVAEMDDQLIIEATRAATSTTDNRNDFRVSVDLQTEIVSPSLSEPCTVRIENISAGGIFFTTHDDFERGMFFSFSLPLPNIRNLLVARIVNRVPGADDGTMGYGCQFIALPGDVESELRKYIFQIQQNRRKHQNLD